MAFKIRSTHKFKSPMSAPIKQETTTTIDSSFDEEPEVVFDVDPITGEISEVMKPKTVVASSSTTTSKPPLQQLRKFDPSKPMGHAMRKINEESFM